MDKKLIKSYKAWILVFITFLFLLINTGCNSTDSNDKTSANTTNPANSNTKQTDSKQETDKDKASSETEKDNHNNAKANKTQEVECDWTLVVNDTVSTEVNGYDFKCTLNVNAVKIGGKNDIGAYGGTVKLSYEYNMQSRGVTGNATGAGQDPHTVITVAPYDAAKYSDFGTSNGNSPLAPLIAYDSMALGNFNLAGNGLSNESANGAEWSKQESKSVSVPYKIAIEGGQVVLELPSIAPNVKFKGMVTGTPR